MTPYLIPNQLYQIVINFLKHSFFKFAKNTQAEQRNIYTFLVALIRYQTWRQNSKWAVLSKNTIQDVSMSISIVVKFEEMSEDNDGDDESDKHLEAQDRRYSCLKCPKQLENFIMKTRSLNTCLLVLILH